MKNKGRRVVVSVGLFLLITTIGGLLLKGIIDTALYNRFPDRGVPRINIDLNGVSLDEIKNESKEIKYADNQLQIYNHSRISAYDEVEIKGRGNGTWIREKKPFQIKFEEKVDMLGMGRAKKWYLLSDELDDAQIRNAIAFDLERIIGMDYSFRGSFVELYINGEYEGLYYLTNAIEISKNSIDLKDPMGILVELDNIYGLREEYYTTSNGDILVIKDVVNNSKKDDAMKNFLDTYNRLENAVSRKDYREIESIIDVESWADYYLLSEFSVNPDAYWTSFYFYKDGLNDKIHAGPGWDFDLAFGNKNWGNWIGVIFYSTEETMVRKQELPLREEYEKESSDDIASGSGFLSEIMFRLTEIPEFSNVIKAEFQRKMSGRKTEYVIQVRKRAESIAKIAEIDNEMWDKGDYHEEVDAMIEWIEKRYDFFEREYGLGVENSVNFL